MKKQQQREYLNIKMYLNMIREKLANVEFLTFDDLKKELENDGHIINADFFSAINILNKHKLLFIYVSRKMNKKFVSMKKEFLDPLKRCTRDLDIPAIQNKILKFLEDHGPARSATISGRTGVSMFRLKKILPDFLSSGIIKVNRSDKDQANYYCLQV